MTTSFSFTQGLTPGVKEVQNILRHCMTRGLTPGVKELTVRTPLCGSKFGSVNETVRSRERHCVKV